MVRTDFYSGEPLEGATLEIDPHTGERVLDITNTPLHMKAPDVVMTPEGPYILHPENVQDQNMNQQYGYNNYNQSMYNPQYGQMTQPQYPNMGLNTGYPQGYTGTMYQQPNMGYPQVYTEDMNMYQQQQVSPYNTQYVDPNYMNQQPQMMYGQQPMNPYYQGYPTPQPIYGQQPMMDPNYMAYQQQQQMAYQPQPMMYGQPAMDPNYAAYQQSMMYQQQQPMMDQQPQGPGIPTPDGGMIIPAQYDENGRLVTPEIKLDRRPQPIKSNINLNDPNLVPPSQPIPEYVQRAQMQAQQQMMYPQPQPQPQYQQGYPMYGQQQPPYNYNGIGSGVNPAIGYIQRNQWNQFNNSGSDTYINDKVVHVPGFNPGGSDILLSADVKEKCEELQVEMYREMEREKDNKRMSYNNNYAGYNYYGLNPYDYLYGQNSRVINKYTNIIDEMRQQAVQSRVNLNKKLSRLVHNYLGDDISEEDLNRTYEGYDYTIPGKTIKNYREQDRLAACFEIDPSIPYRNHNTMVSAEYNQIVRPNGNLNDFLGDLGMLRLYYDLEESEHAQRDMSGYIMKEDMGRKIMLGHLRKRLDKNGGVNPGLSANIDGVEVPYSLLFTNNIQPVYDPDDERVSIRNNEPDLDTRKLAESIILNNKLAGAPRNQDGSVYTGQVPPGTPMPNNNVLPEDVITDSGDEDDDSGEMSIFNMEDVYADVASSLGMPAGMTIGPDGTLSVSVPPGLGGPHTKEEVEQAERISQRVINKLQDSYNERYREFEASVYGPKTKFTDMGGGM